MSAVSARAARYAHRHRIPLSQAARRFRVSRQAVQKAWKKLELGETPLSARWAERRALAMSMSRDGRSAQQIADRLRITKNAVYYLLRTHEES